MPCDESQILVACQNGTVRLHGSGYSTMGRVEVCMNGEWGSICRDSFDDNDAHVVCSQLGYSPYGKLYTLKLFIVKLYLKEP